MSKIWVLQNAPPENLGIADQVLQSNGLAPAYVRTFAGEEVPRYMEDAAGLVILGGPMGVYERDRYPFIDAAMRLIDQALKQDKPILGICLGSQLLATALGARVTRGAHKEIGWYPIELQPAANQDPLVSGLEPSFMGYHWHGDIFELPDGATALASSAHTAYQAFSYGRAAYGVLFHMEVTAQIIADMVWAFADEVREAGLDGEQIKTDAAQHLPALHANGQTFFQNWATLCLAAISH